MLSDMLSLYHLSLVHRGMDNIAIFLYDVLREEDEPMDEEDLLNMVIMERMSWHCRQFRKERPGEGQGSHRSRYALEQLEKMYARLEPEVIIALNDCVDEMSHLLAADDEMYYRAGIADGIRLDQLIKQIKEKQE